MLPEAYGGSGLGMVDTALIVEELCAAGAGSTLAQIFMLNPIFGGVAISRYGTEEMKRQWLPKLCSGEMTLSMGLTEPDDGSNSLAGRTFARQSGKAACRERGR